MYDDLTDKFNDPYNSEVASLKGKCFRAGYRDELAAGTYYLAHVPQAGKKLKFISFSGSLDGQVEVDLLLANSSDITLGAEEETINGCNLDNTLNSISSNPLKKVTSITGTFDVLPLAYIETPNASGQALTNTLSSDVRSIYSSDRPAYIRLNVISNSKVNLVWVWEEE